MKDKERWRKVSGETGIYERNRRFRIRFEGVQGTSCSRVVGPDLAEARQARQEIVELRSRGIELPKRSKPLASIAQDWLQELRLRVEGGDLSAGTLRRYEELVRSSINPQLGKELARSIDRFGISRFLEQLQADGLAPSTCELALKLLRQLLEHALERELHGRPGRGQRLRQRLRNTPSNECWPPRHRLGNLPSRLSQQQVFAPASCSPFAGATSKAVQWRSAACGERMAPSPSFFHWIPAGARSFSRSR